MINFAHGEIYMIGAFCGLISFIVLGLGGVTWVPLALLIVLVVSMVFTAGLWVDRRAGRLPAAARLFSLGAPNFRHRMSIFLQTMYSYCKAPGSSRCSQSSREV